MYEALSASDVIETLDLEPHPEGGWFRAVGGGVAGADAAGAAIQHLLDAQTPSPWRRVETREVWRYCAGAPLDLTLSPNGRDLESRLLGPGLPTPRRPQVAVPAGWWRCAAPMGAWTLVLRLTAATGGIDDDATASPDRGRLPEGGA